jgi:hypothetical protein
MQAIHAVFDGNNFTPIEPIPIKGKYEPVDTKETKRQRILKHFGTWDDEDIKTINTVVEERSNFSLSRGEE